MKRSTSTQPLWRRLLHGPLVVIGAVGLTLVMFLILPLMQTISQPPADALMLTPVDTAQLPPPPPPPPESEPEKEPEPEETPPDLAEEAPPLNLSEMELALNAVGGGEGWLQGDFGLSKVEKLATADSGQDVDALFSLQDLDQKPRAIHQPGPALTDKLRRSGPATVHVIFVVDQRGRVEIASVQSSSDPLFDAAALSAVKQWKFEPGKRGGQPVRFRMRVPITFPKAG